MKIAVIGDVLIDKYIYKIVDRIYLEILILKYKSSISFLSKAILLLLSGQIPAGPHRR
jgi:hypothetical protein